MGCGIDNGQESLWSGRARKTHLSSRVPTFLCSLCQSKLFFDQIYGFYIKRIQDPLTRFIEVMELLFISGLLVRGTAGVAGLFALIGRKFVTTERFTAYAFWFIAGTIAFLSLRIRSIWRIREPLP